MHPNISLILYVKVDKADKKVKIIALLLNVFIIFKAADEGEASVHGNSYTTG